MKLRGSLTILGIADEGLSRSNSVMGSDGFAMIGIRVQPSLHIGAGYRQIDYERNVDLFWGPSLYRRLEAWTEYEQWIDQTHVRFRTGLASIVQSERPLLPFVEGSIRGQIAEHATIGLRAELGRDTRSIRRLRFENGPDQVLTVALLEATLTWHF